MQIETHQLSKYQANTPPTFIVLGIARGGTSLFAGILHSMGVFMGDDLTVPNYEDWHLSKALRSGNVDEINKIISSYNSVATKTGWAFKHPALNHLVISNLSSFRNPVILLVKKDIFAVARRRAEINGQSKYVSLIYVYVTYYLLRWKAMRTGAPLIIVEYTSATKYPKQWLQQFCQLFSHIPLNNQAALSFIENGKVEYLKWKESYKQWMKTPFMGSVDIISPQLLAGWAMHSKHNKPVLVEVRVNGKRHSSFRAEAFREDVNRRVHGSNGYCGFNFSFEMPLTESELSTLEIFVEGVLFWTAVEHLRSS